MTVAKQSSRHRSREVALQVLYALDLAASRVEATGNGDMPQVGAVFDSVAAHFEMPAGAREFALELASQVARYQDELDDRIAEWARNWRVDRMATVDRNVLRLAVYELCHTETPTAVILDEAVELARHFGSDTSPAFVNGILGAVAKAVREPEA